MNIIAVTGPIRHGKSAFIDAIQAADPQAQINESSTVIAKAANHLNTSLGQRYGDRFSACDTAIAEWLTTAVPTAVRQATTVTFNKTPLRTDVGDFRNQPALYAKLWEYISVVEDYPGLLDTRDVLSDKETFRPLLQWLGGFVTTRLGHSLWYEELINQAGLAADDGCTTYVIGGLRFPVDAQVIRRTPGACIVGIDRPGQPEPDQDDPTEVLRTQIQTDTHVTNDGTLGQLGKLAAQLLHDIPAKKLRPDYRASSF